MSAQVIRQQIFKFLYLEMEAQNIETSCIRDGSPPEMQFISLLKTLIIRVFEPPDNTSSDEPPSVETLEVDSRSMEASPQAETTLKPTSAEPPPPAQYFDSHFVPERRPKVTPFGRIVDFVAERRVRCIENGNTVGPVWLSWTEWEVTVALFEAGDTGLTLSELAAKVSRWRDMPPSSEAVQRIVSKVTVKFDDAGLPFRGRTENVNPALSKPSKKRRRGRPPKPGDGQFRAYLYEASPCNQRS